MKKIFLILLCLHAFACFCLAQNKISVRPDTLPAAALSYSQAVVVNKGKLIYISGQIPVDRYNHIVGLHDFKAQVRQAFNNLTYVLSSAGSSINDLIKLNIYIVNLDDEKLKLYRQVKNDFPISFHRPQRFWA